MFTSWSPTCAREEKPAAIEIWPTLCYKPSSAPQFKVQTIIVQTIKVQTIIVQTTVTLTTSASTNKFDAAWAINQALLFCK